ncbi:Folylpolyglutamate synthetase family protein isoform 1 [Hibiscus syriacus]|uniref:Folylpolyglutamate synthetase family protein isoform 1 n=2 Tax=Hibiscus syriacus TaxID=106335 RepID=A0A6A2Y2H1_HIBSY|nr:Folylpolyglutamate synthetase family protein isoform 1 [Hibiscus syriacus]
METNLEEAEEKVPKAELVYDREVEKCRCGELEARSKKAEARCLELELEIRKRKSGYEALETKVRTLEVAKLALEDEIKILKCPNNEVSDRISHIGDERVVGYGEKGLIEGAVNLTEESDEEDKVFQLMAENKVLECEKSTAENEAEVWKRKFKELESLTSQLQKSLVLKTVEQPFDTNNPDVNKTNGGSTSNDMSVIVGAPSIVDSVPALISPGKGTGNLQPAGTPSNGTPYKGDYRTRSSKRVKRPLSFQGERSPNKQMAPSTPAGVKLASVGIIDIHDSDDEPAVDSNLLSKHELEGTVDCENGTGAIVEWNQEEKEGSYVDNVSFVSVHKRKRAFNIVTSDSESDKDNVPIGELRRMLCKEVVPAVTTPEIDKGRGTFTTRKRRLVLCSLSEGKEKNCSSRNNSGSRFIEGTPTTKDVEDDDSDGIGPESNSESHSLNGFIVKDSNTTDCDDSCSELQDGSDRDNACSGQEDVSGGCGACSDSKDASDDEVDFDVILSQIRRNKDHKSDWKFEGELLAAFGKDPELCMKAVCALYRQQTSGEKLSKATLCQNQRGFSKFDAYRGCTLAEFLTDGDPKGDVKKSVEELEAYDPNGVELCRNLATRYSKQLFGIYKSKEDPYFLHP